eukprot:4698069-Prorocentrum_lima.AAC.1
MSRLTSAPSHLSSAPRRIAWHLRSISGARPGGKYAEVKETTAPEPGNRTSASSRYPGMCSCVRIT